MSRGIVLWPDDATSSRIQSMWSSLAQRDIPSLATQTHRLHQPHLSLVVAEDLPVDTALSAIGQTPQQSLGLLVDSIGIFPPMGTLFLACVVSHELLTEQQRAFDRVVSVARDPWPYFQPGRWAPHITLSLSLTPAEVSAALPIILEQLPLEGSLTHGGLEDGTTGERWPSRENTTSG